MLITKALERLLGWIYIMAYVDPASNPETKPSGWLLKMAKVILQITFKHSKPFLK
jgi:hypothetical protein